MNIRWLSHNYRVYKTDKSNGVFHNVFCNVAGNSHWDQTANTQPRWFEYEEEEETVQTGEDSINRRLPVWGWTANFRY
ncbi:hypothetical protein M8J76_001280 [Diaphorina citri]|nr:hypothetical protein M8J76_001280 [Diaphorina citri]